MTTATRPMSRSEVTRAAILDAASSCFGSLGFAAASMDHIAAEAGVTKPTVYAHFGDKATLFEEAIRRQLASYHDRPVRPASTRGEMAEALEQLAREYLDWLHAEPRFGLLRAAASETMQRPEWAQGLLADLGPGELVSWLRGVDEAGLADVPDPETAAHVHHALLKGSSFYPAVLGLIPAPGPAERAQLAKTTTEVFVRAHLPATTDP